MKIQEVLSDPDSYGARVSKDYWAKFKVSGCERGNATKVISQRTKLVDKSGTKFLPDIAYVMILPRVNYETFYWPFDDMRGKLLRAGDLWGQNGSVTLENFKEVPNGFTGYSFSARLGSFAGIEYITSMEQLNLHILPGFAGGVLKLLKVPNLRAIIISDQQLNEKNVDFEKAIEIVQRHLQNKNVPECQQELIEAGFEQFAKL